jgi:hypothetical protein
VADTEKFILQVNQMAATVPVAAPWTAASATDWDSQTLETFKQANVPSPNGKALVDAGVEAVFAAEPRDVSLLFALFYTASGTNETTAPDINRLFSTAGRRLAVDLDPHGPAPRTPGAAGSACAADRADPVRGPRDH